MEGSRDVIIQVLDLAAATAFYEDVVGLEVFTRSPTLTGFSAGNFRLFVEPGATPGPVFEFHANDFDTARSRLLEAGCRIVDENPSEPRCYMQDPFGLVFNLAA